MSHEEIMKASNECFNSQNWEMFYKHHEIRLKIFPFIEDGFKEYDSNKRFNGQDLKGKIVVAVREQGSGDCFMWTRFLADLKKLGCIVVCHTYEKLATLMEQQSYIDFVTTIAPKTYDYWMPMFSIPALLEMKTMPSEPYIKCTDSIKFGERPNVGICWAGNPGFGGDQTRSSPLKEWGPIIELGNIISLQVDKRKRCYAEKPDHQIDLSEHPQEWQITDVEPYLIDYRHTAGWLNNIDWVASVDTSLVHLAGSLGRNTICLISKKHACWRWGNKDTSDLYPTLHIVRQDNYGDWASAIAKAAKIIKQNRDETCVVSTLPCHHSKQQ